MDITRISGSLEWEIIFFFADNTWNAVQVI